MLLCPLCHRPCHSPWRPRFTHFLMWPQACGFVAQGVQLEERTVFVSKSLQSRPLSNCLCFWVSGGREPTLRAERRSVIVGSHRIRCDFLPKPFTEDIDHDYRPVMTPLYSNHVLGFSFTCYKLYLILDSRQDQLFLSYIMMPCFGTQTLGTFNLLILA